MKMRDTSRLLILMAVFVLYTLGYFFIIGAESITKVFIFQFDLINLFLPAIIAFVLYFQVLRFKRHSVPASTVVGYAVISFVLTVLSTLAGLTVRFNVYGS